MPLHAPSVQNAVHLECGRSNDVAFVFSCPGRKEYEARPQGPAKGDTGTNLNDLLGIMRKKYAGTVMKITAPKRFSRDEIWITNAWSEVEYKTKTGRSEAKEEEILHPDNLDRLYRDLSRIERAIICCGRRAGAAVRELRRRNRIEISVGLFCIPHLGNRSLNTSIRLEATEGDTSCEMRTRRLEIVAERLHEQIDSWFSAEASRQSRVIAASPQEREDQGFVDAVSYRGDE